MAMDLFHVQGSSKSAHSVLSTSKFTQHREIICTVERPPIKYRYHIRALVWGVGCDRQDLSGVDLDPMCQLLTVSMTGNYGSQSYKPRLQYSCQVYCLGDSLRLVECQECQC